MNLLNFRSPKSPISLPRLFRIIVVGSLLVLGSHSAQSTPMTMIFDFTGDSPASPWRSTNDGVMGGLSEGGATLTEEGMRFTGVLSLENNGGFSWIHKSGTYDLSDSKGIRFRVLGDGRTYQLRLQTDARYRVFGQVAFSKSFETRAGEWTEVFVPFSELEQSWRGRQLSGYTFDPSKIQRIGFMLADKQAGPFDLVVGWLAASTG